ncbi:MAG TPA: hypothetical protein VMM15_02705 [Bradyrhizobium sp.]|nr:hypothetical protein [Bradyrhizobium sp.]
MSTREPIDVVTRAEAFIRQDDIHEPMHDRFLRATMQRRNPEAAALPEWEELREFGSQIKEHALTHLDEFARTIGTDPSRKAP